MPVPVAVTHTKGVGLEAASTTELATAGPFARAAAARDSAGDAPPAEIPLSPASEAAAPPQTSATQDRAASDLPAIGTNGLDFSYPGIDGRPLPGIAPVVRDMSVSIKPGTRTLLIGPNGAGKTTLLKILGGKHMVPQGAVQVLGEPPFHATALTSSGELSYIGGNWERDIAFAGYAIPLQGDFTAEKMIKGVPGVDAARQNRLMKVLDVNPGWRMNTVSDGQRRRVQLVMGLLKPFKVLLLDEITVDLDVLGRSDLMNYLRSESEERGACIVYATHIFDGLEAWPTHLMYLADGQLKEFGPASQFPELQKGRLMNLVEGWLRAEQVIQRERKAIAAAAPKVPKAPEPAIWSNGWAAGRLTSTMKDSSNAVVRM